MKNKSQSEPPRYFYIIAWSGFAYIPTTGISADAVVELGREALMVPKVVDEVVWSL